MDVRLGLLNETLQRMYEVISFPEGGEPDWEGMKAIFLSNARFARVTPEGIDYFDLQTFQAMAAEMLDRGVYTAFFELEVARCGHLQGCGSCGECLRE